ncbi:MAG: HIT family protein [Bacteroidia bacterium]
MASLFSKIVKGEIPCYKIAETEDHLAFLDVFPLAKGHALVIPKKETDYIFDMEDKEFSQLQLFSKKVARAIEKVIPCKRIGVAVIGLEIPHAHIHLIPLSNVSDINFSGPKLNLSKEELEETAKKIREQLS